jgi:hypothetical protein
MLINGHWIQFNPSQEAWRVIRKTEWDRYIQSGGNPEKFDRGVGFHTQEGAIIHAESR